MELILVEHFNAEFEWKSIFKPTRGNDNFIKSVMIIVVNSADMHYIIYKHTWAFCDGMT
jgi:hypothetical protein